MNSKTKTTPHDRAHLLLLILTYIVENPWWHDHNPILLMQFTKIETIAYGCVGKTHTLQRCESL
jgi:hypothetical protein